MSSLEEAVLRKMSYSELRKHAKKYGVKVNTKAENIIESLLDKTGADEDSFVTLERSIINSCKKNKEKLFDKDKQVISDTPRRGTYTVDDTPRRETYTVDDTPRRETYTVDDTPRRETYSVTDPVADLTAINASMVMASASPELKNVAKEESLNVTVGCASVKTSPKSKRKVSFVTPMRRSARITKSTATPLYNSVKDRPKTPMPTRLSSATKHVSFQNKEKDSVVGSLNLDISENDTMMSSGGRVKRPSTPMPLAKQKRRRLSSVDRTTEDILTPGFRLIPEMVPALQQLQEEDSNEVSSKLFSATPSTSSNSEEKRIESPTKPFSAELSDAEKNITDTPNSNSPAFKKVVTPFPASKKASLRSSVVTSAVTPGLSSSAIKKTLTPGFKKIATPLPESKRTSPRSGVTSASTPGLSSSAIKRTVTPNFQKLHQKEFDKMESIGEYQKRVMQNSAKKFKEQRKFHTPAKSNDPKIMAADKIKKIPETFSGIPFIRAAATTRSMKMQTRKLSGLKPEIAPSSDKIKKVPETFAGIPFVRAAATTRPLKINTQKPSGLKPKLAPSSKSGALSESTLSRKLIKAGNVKAIKSVTRENAPLKQRHKFDLRASLAKKLPYKPHSGPLKPLADVNLNSTVNAFSVPLTIKNDTENRIVKASRIQSREILRGVRKNKRFNLQMNNRNLNMSVQ